MPIHARDQVSYISVYLLLGPLVWVVARSIVLEDFNKGQYTAASLLAFLAILSGWTKARQSCRRTEIDAQGKQVTIHSVSPLFSPIQHRYPLEQFGSVRSYITLGRFPQNLVELVTQSGGEALLVAAFSPRGGAPTFWSMPTETENVKAMRLRQTISDQCGLVDQGFLSPRMVGALIKD
ncbi:hypothetical protein [Acidovorax delafieldii]|uniref:hypothetical protein n=1 Tax=Acidovorax delafieldii TaxID=47920 RepID=UPI003F502159